MIEFRCELTAKQNAMLQERLKRVMFKRCAESVLQERAAAAVCESELFELIKKYDLCDVCDFSGLHISVAKMLVRSVISATYRYPRLRGIMNFIGSRKGYVELLDKLSKNNQEVVRALSMQYIMDADAITSIGNTVKELLAQPDSSSENMLAQAVSLLGIVDGILIDEEDFNRKDFRQIKIDLEQAVAVKHLPQGCASVEAVVYHEIGHMLDFLCGVSKMRDVVSEFNTFTKDYLKNNLSSYSATSVEEYVAEGFAEGMVSPAPRAIAKGILRRIDECYNAL